MLYKRAKDKGEKKRKKKKKKKRKKKEHEQKANKHTILIRSKLIFCQSEFFL